MAACRDGRRGEERVRAATRPGQPASQPVSCGTAGPAGRLFLSGTENTQTVRQSDSQTLPAGCMGNTSHLTYPLYCISSTPHTSHILYILYILYTSHLRLINHLAADTNNMREAKCGLHQSAVWQTWLSSVMFCNDRLEDGRPAIKTKSGSSNSQIGG